MGLPRTFNKKQLCVHVKLITIGKDKEGKPRYRIKYRELRQHYFTDEILERLGITYDEYKRMSIFPAHICKAIVEEFDLQEEDE